jgi:hypothetical protein
VHAFGFEQRLILFDQRIFRFGQYAHEVLFAQGAQLDTNGKTALKLGNQVGWFGAMKSARGDKKNMIGLDHAVLGVDRRTFDDRQ